MRTKGKTVPRSIERRCKQLLRNPELTVQMIAARLDVSDAFVRAAKKGKAK